MSRRTLISTLAAAALSVAIAGPALAAAPTFSGTLTCIAVHDGEVDDLPTLTGSTKKEVAEAKRFWTSNGYCEKGSVDTSGLTKD